MVNQVFSIRGATTVDANVQEEIIARSVELMGAIIARNGIDGSTLKITDYLVSTTDDITAFYPAQAIRESGLTDAPVFSVREPSIVGALKPCIRILVRVANSGEEREPVHVYMRGARVLRPDLLGEENGGLF